MSASLWRGRGRSSADRERGFTLVELLVVVIVIGILTAIAIPVYLGVQRSAQDAGVKSDLHNQKAALVAYLQQNGALPTPAQFTVSALGNLGFTKGSSLASETYTTGADNTYCLFVTSTSGNTFFITSSSANSGSVPTSGAACPNSPLWY